MDHTGEEESGQCITEEAGCWSKARGFAEIEVAEIRAERSWVEKCLSAWVSVFLVQTLLIARGSRRLHQRLGWFAVGMLSATILLLGAPMFRVVSHYVGIADMSKVGIISTLLVDAFFLPCLPTTC